MASTNCAAAQTGVHEFLQVQLPPAMEAATRPQQSIDFAYERKVMQEEPSTSMEAFFAKAEVRRHLREGVWCC